MMARAAPAEVMAREIDEAEDPQMEVGGDAGHAVEVEREEGEVLLGAAGLGAAGLAGLGAAAAAAAATAARKEREAQHRASIKRRQLETATQIQLDEACVATLVKRSSSDRFGATELRTASGGETDAHPVLEHMASTNSALCTRTVNGVKASAVAVTAMLNQLQAVVELLPPTEKGLAALGYVNGCAIALCGMEGDVMAEARLVLDQVTETAILLEACLAANSYAPLGSFTPTLGVQEPQSAGVAKAQRLLDAAKASQTPKDSKLIMELFRRNRGRSRSPVRKERRCYTCDEVGHFAPACPQNPLNGRVKNSSRSRSRSRSPGRRGSRSPRRKGASAERQRSSGSNRASSRR